MVFKSRPPSVHYSLKVKDHFPTENKVNLTYKVMVLFTHGKVYSGTRDTIQLYLCREVVLFTEVVNVLQIIGRVNIWDHKQCPFSLSGLLYNVPISEAIGSLYVER